MSGFCNTCANWGPCKQYETGHGLGLGRCNAAPMLWYATEWSSDEDGRQLKAEFSDVKHFVQDASDYSARLYTKPDFGCVSYLPMKGATNDQA